MMLRSGFSFVEVICGLVISALIATVLFQALFQTNSVLKRVDALSSLERRVMLVQQQFESDFSGMFAPALTESDDDEADEEQSSSKQHKKEQSKTKEGDLKEEDSTGFKTFTFEADERGLVKILSFVTTNPLAIYQQPSPRAVRIAYRVIADSENEGKLLLIRQESAEELSLKRFDQATNKSTIQPGQAPVRSYEIARNIENIKFEFFIEKIENKQPEKKSSPASAAEVKPEEKKKEEEEKARGYFSLDEWKNLSIEEKKKFQKPEIPAYCSLKLFLNDERKRVHSFEFLFFSSVGIAPVIVKGPTSLPSASELEQRKAGQAETDRMMLHNGIPQFGRG